MSYLLDTNVISEFATPVPSLAVQNWFLEHQSQGLYLSVVTIGEIQQGIVRLPASGKKTHLQNWFQESILDRYSDFIIPVDTDTMVEWGNLMGKLTQQGRKMSVMDSLIAATALQHQLKLVTRNESDFLATELELINPW